MAFKNKDASTGQAGDNVVRIEQKAPNWVNTMISTVSQRFSQSLFGISKDGKRDINRIFGYQPSLSFDHFYSMYARGGLAARIINMIPRSCWRDGVAVVEGETPVLVEELRILERHGRLTQKLERADILNRIGKFSVLFVGIPDGLDPSKPVGTANPKRLKDVYFAPYAEDGIEIVQWENDPASPRYGQPLMYQLSQQYRQDSDKAILTKPRKVHYTRIVHIAEGLLDNEIEGTPALQAVFNTIEDLAKTTGGSAEAYFRNARNRFAMEVDPKFNAQITPENKAFLEEEAQKFQNEWQDFIRAGGFVVKPLSIPHNDPTGTVQALVKVIAGTVGIPIRILTGEGAGQLAGNEDKESYNQLVQDRKEVYCSDWVIGALSILAAAKMITLSDSARVLWKTPETLSESDKAGISTQKATALASVATALSTPALDGKLQIDEVLTLVFGEEDAINLTVDESGDDGLDDELPEGEPPAGSLAADFMAKAGMNG